MTDNEIIKALECLCGGGDSCTECVYHKRYRFGEYRKQVAKDTLDLINCLQSQNKDLAEAIHNLTLEKDALFDKAEELKVEVERLKEIIEYKDICIEACEDTKSESVKEFARRLKCGVPQETGVIRCSDIDNLLKEKVGENNG